MKLLERINKIKTFALRAVGKLPGPDGQIQSLPARIIRVGHLLFKGYIEDDLTIHASSLTFVTLTSLVPILAVAFALMKGFGMGSDQLDNLLHAEWVQEMPESFQTFWNQILDIVNITNFFALGWIGLAFFVLTAVLVLANVEKSFNRVWGVAKDRSLPRQIANYTSVLVLVPLLLGVAGGLRAQVAFNQTFFQVDLTAWAQNLISLFILWLALGVLFVLVPNTTVRLRPAMASSLLTTVVFLGWMKVFTVMQVGVARYNFIYGAFAAVPVFMFWMYVTWVILLLGAELAFALQNSDTFQLESAADSASTRMRILVALMILRQAGMVMVKGTGVFSVAVFARKNRAPIRLINSVIAVLTRQGYLAQVAGRDAGFVLMRAPENLPLRNVVSDMMRAGGDNLELEKSLMVDPALKSMLSKIETGLDQGFGALTVADLVAAAASPATP